MCFIFILHQCLLIHLPSYIKMPLKFIPPHSIESGLYQMQMWLWTIAENMFVSRYLKITYKAFIILSSAKLSNPFYCLHFSLPFWTAGDVFLFDSCILDRYLPCCVLLSLVLLRAYILPSFSALYPFESVWPQCCCLSSGIISKKSIPDTFYLHASLNLGT